MEVDGQPCPGRFIPVKKVPGTNWTGSWVDPRASLDVLGNRRVSCPCWDLNPRHPACSFVTTLSTLWSWLPSVDAMEKTKSRGGGGGGLSVLYMIWGTACCRKFLVPAGNYSKSSLSLYHNLYTDWGILVQLALL
jgi:hypothetical protein